MIANVKKYASVSGLIIGLLWALCYYLLSVLISAGWFPKPLAAGILVAAPLVITGGVRLKGFMDCAYDRTLSTVFLFFAFYASALSLDFENENYFILIFIPLILRCCGKIALSVMPASIGSDEEKFQKTVDNKKLAVWFAIVIIAAVLGTVITKFYGLAIVAGLNGFFLTLMYAYRKNDGVSENVVDYAMINGEAWAFMMFALVNPFVDYFMNKVLAF